MKAKPDTHIPLTPDRKFLLSDAEAAEMLGLGVSYFRRLVSNGTVAPVPVQLGRRRLHRRDLLEHWIHLGLPGRVDAVWTHDGGVMLVESGSGAAPGPKPVDPGTAGPQKDGGA